ncbi:MAG: ATP-binding protein [Clostridia bacterium]|nr:ATP-binding protein [Clostridia bacterium]
MNTVIEICATVIDGVFLAWFVSRMHGLSPIKKPKALICVFLFLCYQISVDHFFEVFDLLALAGVLVFAICYSLLVDRKKPIWSVFCGAIYVIVIMLANTMVYSIFSLAIENVDVAIYGTQSYLRIIYLLVCKLAQMAFFRLLLQIFKKEKMLDAKNGVLSFVFTAATAIGLGVLMKIAVEFSHDGMDVSILILAFLLILLNLILYIMIYQLQVLLKSKYELNLMQERMAFEKSRVDEASVIWRNIRQVKHDLKNHFSVMRGQLGNGDVEACKAYIAKLDRTVDNMGNMINSGNSVIDYLINSKLSGLEGVEVLISGYVGSYHDVDDVDLACILGNVLDNATEALHQVEGERRIELLFLQRKANRIIICKNSIKESVLANNRSLKSTKESSDMHGIGHQIVENTVKKYHGLIDYFEEDGMFGVQIMLPETSSPSK